MLTGHLRPGPRDAHKHPQNQKQLKQQQEQEQQPPAGRGRAFKGRGVRPQTWNEDDGLDAPALGGSGFATQVGQQQRRTNNPPSGGEALQQPQQQQQHQNQMRLVVRNPQAVAANDSTFLNEQVSPGALSMVSCSTAYSQSQSQGTRGPSDANFNDSDKHLDTLASVAADIAKRGASANAELVVGLGRSAFEHISMSPSIPLRGNDLAGVSKAIPSQALPSPPVGEVPPLEKRRATAVSAGTRRPKPRRSGSSGSGKPHVLETHSVRSGQVDDSASSSSASVAGNSSSAAYSSNGSRVDVPSLTVTHAPGQVYRPVAAGAAAVVSQHQRRPSSGAVPRGTPATHRSGVHKHAASAADGGVDAPPFRLPSNMRLMSFGSLASSVISPEIDDESGQLQHKQSAASVSAHSGSQDLGEDTSALARRPTTIDALSTFGSHSHVQDGSHMSDLSDLSDSTMTNYARPGAGGGSRSGSRRSSHGGDRISQRRSRSSGSNGGGTRRFDSGSGLMTPERDVRSSGRDRRRNASRSVSGGEVHVSSEVGEYLYRVFQKKFRVPVCKTKCRQLYALHKFKSTSHATGRKWNVRSLVYFSLLTIDIILPSRCCRVDWRSVGCQIGTSRTYYIIFSHYVRSKLVLFVCPVYKQRYDIFCR